MIRTWNWAWLAALIAVACSPPAKVRMLVKMRPGQKDVFQSRILKPFEKKYNCRVQVETYEDPSALVDLLRRPSDSVDLVHTPLDMTRALVGGNLVAPLEEAAEPSEIPEL